MEEKQKKSINQYMRMLHRDIGYFMVGLVIIFAFSGIVLVFRDTDFLKQKKQIERKLKPNMEAEALGKELRIREFKVIKEEGDMLYFNDGSYNKFSGVAVVTVKELIFPINKLTALHKTASKNPLHWFTTIYGILMLFMAISSFWMFKKNSHAFRRGVIISIAGIVFAVVLLMF